MPPFLPYPPLSKHIYPLSLNLICPCLNIFTLSLTLFLPLPYTSHPTYPPLASFTHTSPCLPSRLIPSSLTLSTQSPQSSFSRYIRPSLTLSASSSHSPDPHHIQTLALFTYPSFYLPRLIYSSLTLSAPSLHFPRPSPYLTPYGLPYSLLSHFIHPSPHSLFSHPICPISSFALPSPYLTPYLIRSSLTLSSLSPHWHLPHLICSSLTLSTLHLDLFNPSLIERTNPPNLPLNLFVTLYLIRATKIYQ